MPFIHDMSRHYSVYTLYVCAVYVYTLCVHYISLDTIYDVYALCVSIYYVSIQLSICYMYLYTMMSVQYVYTIWLYV